MKMISITPWICICALGCVGQGLHAIDGADAGTPQTGAYVATVTTLSDDCSPPINPPSNVTARIDAEHAPSLSLDVPFRSFTTGLGGYEFREVTLTGTETFYDSEAACHVRVGTHYTIAAQSSGSLILDEEQTWSPGDAGACSSSVPTSACSYRGRIRYDLTLACAPPCKIVLPNSSPVEPVPATCECP